MEEEIRKRGTKDLTDFERFGQGFPKMIKKKSGFYKCI